MIVRPGSRMKYLTKKPAIQNRVSFMLTNSKLLVLVRVRRFQLWSESHKVMKGI